MRTMTYNPAVNGSLRDFANFASAMNRALGGAQNYDYARSGGAATNEANGVANKPALTTQLPVDITVGEDAFVITAYVPGIKPEEVAITLEGDELTIRGSFPQSGEETKFVKRELFRGAFERKLTFNVPVNVEAIEASHEHGVLTLRVPKAEAIKPKLIKVLAK